MKIGGKYGIAIAFISIILTGVVMFKLGVFGVSANPDFICTKNLSGYACEINESDCTGWSGGQRTCTGQRKSSASYYHTRTSCEGGYNKTQYGSTAGGGTAARYAVYSTLDAGGRSAFSTHPSSGRHGSDYFNYESCNIIQTDTTNAEGVLEIE